MPNSQSNDRRNPWKLFSIVVLAVIGTALITGIVVANFRDSAEPEAAKRVAPKAEPARVAENRPAPAPVPRRPSAADIDHCNSVADDARHSTADTIKDALIGGAVGAGVGAAGGAIAGGGRGAGKGAGIGGIVGATAGTLYGLSSSNRDSPAAERAYEQCMASRGF